MKGYRVVWTLQRGPLGNGEPLEESHAKLVRYKDQVFLAQHTRERDPRMLKKDVQQHEFDRAYYRRQA